MTNLVPVLNRFYLSINSSKMKNSIIFFVVAVAVFAVIYFVFFKKKKPESNWKIEKYSDADNMKAMMGMGNYGSVLGCEGKKCY